METNITSDGVMVRYGSVISTDVSIDLINQDIVRITYTDDMDCFKTDIRNLSDNNEFSFMRNADGIVNSLLSKKDEWLVIWNC